MAAVADYLGWHASTVSRVESGHDELDTVELLHYLGACGVFRKEALDLLALCRQACHRLGYAVDTHGDGLADSLCSVIYRESTADSLVNYQPLLIPGLLQTEEYARSRIQRDPQRSDKNVETRVRARVARQSVLHRPNPARFTFFVHENALRLVVGSLAIMHEQLLQVTLLSALPHVRLHVVPAGEDSVFGAPFVLMSYAKHDPVVSVDGQGTTLFLEDAGYVAGYRETVPDIAAVAMNEGQSREFVATLAHEYDRGSTRQHGDHDLEEEQLQRRR